MRLHATQEKQKKDAAAGKGGIKQSAGELRLQKGAHCQLLHRSSDVE